MLSRIKLFYNTLRYLKPTQIFYQLKYRLIKPGMLAEYDSKFNEILFLNFQLQPPAYIQYLGGNEFDFLNQKVKFETSIQWNYNGNGKLWNYNLQYLNYILQNNVAKDELLQLIHSLYESLQVGAIPLEAYPVSLRVINLIRFFSMNGIKDKRVCACMHAELDFLSRTPEYHLLGNHLLENGFAIFMGGAFFSNNSWLVQGKKILEREISEQIMDDGGHFELSPMYHQIIFFRLLELIDWYRKYKNKDEGFIELLVSYAKKMRSWLNQISFRNGVIPHFNDSTPRVAYDTIWLNQYADNLNVGFIDFITLKDSGYRSYNFGFYECKVDVGAIGSSYQPGHGHADALSFQLYFKNSPLFVEVGTSTYENGAIRDVERSTEAHNTVSYENKNQSEVYGSFRVGKRAITTILSEATDAIQASHTGFQKKYGMIHKRSFKFDKESVFIQDKMEGSGDGISIAYFHIFPGITISKDEDQFIIGDFCRIKFDQFLNLELKHYNFAWGFNKIEPATVICAYFKKRLDSAIQFITHT